MLCKLSYRFFAELCLKNLYILEKLRLKVVFIQIKQIAPSLTQDFRKVMINRVS